MLRRDQIKKISLVVVGAALNLGVGFIVASLKLPFYLDSVGTVLVTGIAGLIPGAACGLLSVLIGSAYTPTLWAYAGTAIAISAYVSAVKRIGYLQRLLPTFLLGCGLGVVSAIVSAPVTTYLWKGVSLSGADAITSFFSATGKVLLDSVILGGIATDPIDKLFTSLIAFALIKRIPSHWNLMATTKRP
jgi:energy-coupling factor transport system substrate-specific component